MAQNARIWLFLLLLVGGCTETTGPDATDANDVGYTLTLTGLPVGVTSPRGAWHTYPISATVIDAKGDPVGGVECVFALTGADGSFSQPRSATGADGRAGTILHLIVPQKTGEAKVTVSTGKSSTFHTVDLQVTSVPVRLRLFTPATTLLITPGEDVSLPLTVVVVDEEHTGVAGLQVSALGDPLTVDGQSTGFFTPPPITDSSGKSQFNFHSGGIPATITVKAYIDDSDPSIRAIEDELTLEVKNLTGEIDRLESRMEPAEITLFEDGVPVVATLSVMALDSENHGVAGVPVKFQARMGSTLAGAVTDEFGRCRGRIIIAPEDIDWENAPEEFTAPVWAHVPGTRREIETNLTVYPNRNPSPELGVTTSTNLIYADNGRTRAWIYAMLKDGETGKGLPGDTLLLIASHGTIQSPLITNSFGHAPADFVDAGQPSLNEFGDPVPAQLIVRHSRFWSVAGGFVANRQRSGCSFPERRGADRGEDRAGPHLA